MFIVLTNFNHLIRRLCKTAKSSYLASSCLSVCPSVWNNSALTGRIFMKFDIWVFLSNLSRKFEFHRNLIRITGTLHEDQYTFLNTSLSVLLRMRSVSDKSFRENLNTLYRQHSFYLKSFRSWDNVEKYCTAVQVIDDIWIYLHKHTIAICNTYCLPTATGVEKRTIILCSCAHCLFCYTITGNNILLIVIIHIICDGEAST